MLFQNVSVFTALVLLAIKKKKNILKRPLRKAMNWKRNWKRLWQGEVFGNGLWGAVKISQTVWKSHTLWRSLIAKRLAIKKLRQLGRFEHRQPLESYGLKMLLPATSFKILWHSNYSCRQTLSLVSLSLCLALFLSLSLSRFLFSFQIYASLFYTSAADLSLGAKTTVPTKLCPNRKLNPWCRGWLMSA